MFFPKIKLEKVWEKPPATPAAAKSNVANAKAAACFFYILTICTPRNTMDKGCENLAASIGSTMLQESG